MAVNLYFSLLHCKLWSCRNLFMPKALDHGMLPRSAVALVACLQVRILKAHVKESENHMTWLQLVILHEQT